MELIIQISWYLTEEVKSLQFQKLWCRKLPVCIMILWFHIMQSRLHLAHWAIIMASTEPTISKWGAVGTMWDITLTIPETPEIIRKPGIVTSQSIIMAAYDTGFLTKYGKKKHKKKITCKNSSQQSYWLTKRKFNNPAPLQSCGCHIK